jgi:hypothetical protein
MSDTLQLITTQSNNLFRGRNYSEHVDKFGRLKIRGLEENPIRIIKMYSNLPCQIVEIDSDHAPFFQHQKS